MPRRAVVALLAGALVAITLGQAFYWQPAIAAAALIGAVVGLIDRSLVRSPLIGGAVAGSLGLLGNLWYAAESLLLTSLLLVGVAAGAAAIAALVRPRWKWSSYVVLGALVVLLWVNALELNETRGTQAQPLFTEISKIPAYGSYVSDGFIFLRTFYLMEAGRDYYASFADAYKGNRLNTGPLASPLNIRPPLLFFAWRLLFDSGRGLYIGLLVVSSAALFAAHAFAKARVGPDVALLAPVLLWPYLLLGATTIFGVFPEYWALPAILGGIACLVRAERDDRWLWAAVALLVLAGLIRETSAYLLVLGLGLSFLPPRERRSSLVWLAGLAVWAMAMAVHWNAASPQVTAVDSAWGVSYWLNGGTTFLLTVFRFGFDVIIGSAWMPLAIYAIGIGGALAARRGFEQRFLTAGLLLPPLGMLFLGTEQFNLYWGAGYRGAVFVPIALACVPLVFLWLRRPAIAAEQ